MSVTVQFDIQKWSDQAKELMVASGRRATDVLRAETRLLCQDCVRLTPPNAKNPFGESFNTQRKAGERAVEHDVRRIFLNPLELQIVQKNAALRQTLEAYLNGMNVPARTSGRTLDKFLAGDQTNAQGAYGKAIVLLRRIGVKIPIVVEATRSLLNASRDRSGRSVPSRRMMVLRPKSIDKLIREVQKDIGKAKAGWNKAAAALGLNLPNWITRHSMPGGYKEDRKQDDLIAIEISNLVAFAQKHNATSRIMQRALDRRATSMKNRLEHILKRGGTTDF